MKKTFNIFNIKLFSHSLLLIELTESQLILSRAKKKRFSGSIYIINVSSTHIEQTCFRNGIIYKPSLIESNISEFLNAQKLQYPKTFISIPDLAKKHDLLMILAILQATLCIGSAKVKISSITDSPFFDAQKNLLPVKIKHNNMLDHLGNNHIRSPYPWLIGSLVCMIVLIIGLKNIIHHNTIQVASLKNQILKSQLSTDTLNKQVKIFAQTKESNTQIKNSLSKLEYSHEKNQNPFDHIMEIASKIPETAYLTTINFYKKTTDIPHVTQKTILKKENYPCIELQGQAKTIQSANHFIHSLTENTDLFKKIDILYVKKIKYLNKSKFIKSNSKNAYPKYQFKAVGELKYIC
ncbi:MAG: hypothetical protein WCS92_05410 [Candidatus Babeliales bacterium]|jgi:Tfp pilus assembly protein PilN